MAHAADDLYSQQVAALVRGSIGRIRQCYDRELARSPRLSGRVELMFSIDPNGVPSVVMVRAPFDFGDVGGCIVDVWRAVRLAAPPEGIATEYSFPFTFSPGT